MYLGKKIFSYLCVMTFITNFKLLSYCGPTVVPYATLHIAKKRTMIILFLMDVHKGSMIVLQNIQLSFLWNIHTVAIPMKCSVSHTQHLSHTQRFINSYRCLVPPRQPLSPGNNFFQWNMLLSRVSINFLNSKSLAYLISKIL